MHIAELGSKQHVLLQRFDAVLGVMRFRLDNKQKIKPAQSRVRGKRTRAAERVYRHILEHIRILYPGFNIGIRAVSAAITPIAGATRIGTGFFFLKTE